MKTKSSTVERDRISKAVGIWIDRLNEYPGFKDWKSAQTGRTLWFDDPIPFNTSHPNEFKFSDELEKQHLLVTRYMHLIQTALALEECQYYFRRYPFRGLPVTRYNHLTNVCEMYFNRFYEFKARLKNHFEALKKINPQHKLEIGKFIKLYETVFEAELRERNGVHHRERFEDVSLDRLFLTHMRSLIMSDGGWQEEHLLAYRKFTREWIARVQRRSDTLGEFIEAVAKATLDTCPFLSEIAS